MITEDSNKDFGEIEIQVLKHVKVLVSDLKAAVDVMAVSSETVRDHILEIATQVDERQLCKQDEISRLIKRLLKDKIAEGKITERWIEDCLPKEYKRKYEKRSTSLSEMVESRQPDGTVVLQEAHDTESDEDNEVRRDEDDPKYDSQRSKTAENSVNFRQVEVPKVMKSAILKALDECEQKCFLTFDMAGTFLAIESDVNRKIVSNDEGGR